MVSCTVWQADVMEVLYRAAKQDTLRDGGITFQGQPKVKAIFEALVNKSVQVCMRCLTLVVGHCCRLLVIVQLLIIAIITGLIKGS